MLIIVAVSNPSVVRKASVRITPPFFTACALNTAWAHWATVCAVQWWGACLQRNVTPQRRVAQCASSSHGVARILCSCRDVVSAPLRSCRRPGTAGRRGPTRLIKCRTYARDWKRQTLSRPTRIEMATALTLILIAY